MTIEEAYTRMGADYEDVIRRLRKADRVKRFLLMLPEDENYFQLCSALENENVKEAFRAAHTLKGICMNLGLTSLFHSVSDLTEALRDEKIGEGIGPLMEQLKEDYKRAVHVIREFTESENL